MLCCVRLLCMLDVAQLYGVVWCVCACVFVRSLLPVVGCFNVGVQICVLA